MIVSLLSSQIDYNSIQQLLNFLLYFSEEEQLMIIKLIPSWPLPLHMLFQLDLQSDSFSEYSESIPSSRSQK